MGSAHRRSRRCVELQHAAEEAGNLNFFVCVGFKQLLSHTHRRSGLLSFLLEHITGTFVVRCFKT